jgi:hypothetical protein
MTILFLKMVRGYWCSKLNGYWFQTERNYACGLLEILIVRYEKGLVNTVYHG